MDLLTDTSVWETWYNNPTLKHNFILHTFDLEGCAKLGEMHELVQMALHLLITYNNSGEPAQVKGRKAEIWKIDFQTGSVKLYTSGTISAFSTQRTYLVLNAEFQEHIDGAPVVLKSKENKYVLLGILPELLPKTSNPSKYDGGRVDMEETFSFVEIERLIEKVQ